MQRKLFVKFPVPFLMKSETAVTFARCGTVTSILLRLGFGDALLLRIGHGSGNLSLTRIFAQKPGLRVHSEPENLKKVQTKDTREIK